ncbi:hypothetical protein EI94DRAFT_69567 [Lactarius quietus]|nr:hypothetical protein EI94DRAFT_69567 [Lactarius quietus]
MARETNIGRGGYIERKGEGQCGTPAGCTKVGRDHRGTNKGAETGTFKQCRERDLASEARSTCKESNDATSGSRHPQARKEDSALLAWSSRGSRPSVPGYGDDEGESCPTGASPGSRIAGASA